MSTVEANNRDKKNYTDTWLTPIDVIDALGPFNMDPCCPPKMPWRTAKHMLTEKEDGLTTPWKGRVFMNNPYSNPMPWVEKFVKHGNGIALVGGRSPETRWFQLLASHADLIVYPPYRFKFCDTKGRVSKSTWQPSALVAIGKTNVNKLEKWAVREGGLILTVKR